MSADPYPRRIPVCHIAVLRGRRYPETGENQAIVFKPLGMRVPL
ncbi:MAG: hypothetical protein OJF51_003213 [Nitrospira sp.]|nr:MAG: hypothetical protein OJF51_003213 [Nitrospira sp.]